jgi:hypothetical protein
LAVIYSIVTPIFESPDELWHYPFVWHLARTAELPIQDPAKPQLWAQEGSQPPLYYALAALLTAAISADDLPTLIYPNPHADIGLVSPDGNANIIVHTAREQWPWRGAVLAIHLTRLFSALLGTGAVLTVYALGRTLCPPTHPTHQLTNSLNSSNSPKLHYLPLLAMTFVAFNPMFLFISGSVNNDNLITLLASLVLWQLASLILANSPTHQTPQLPNSSNSSTHPAPQLIWPFIRLGFLIGLAALTKLSGLALLALTTLVLLVWGVKQCSWRIAILGNSLVGLVALAIAGWWYWRNLTLYGDWTGTEPMVQMMGRRSITPTAEQLLAELPGLFRSFWGLFGYFSIPLPTPLYWLLNLLLAIGLLGFLFALFPIRPNRTRQLPQLPNSLNSLSAGLQKTWPIFLAWLLLIALALLQWTLRTPATQGRLLFPALAPLAILWAAGWLTLLPARWSLLPAFLMAVLAIWTPWGVIAPAYAKPTPLSALPSSAQSLNATFGQAIQLLAYDLEGVTALKPGQTLPVTLYWRGHKPIESDYTVFLHLVDEADLIVAQRDLFHGPGVYPSTQWISGQIFYDRYVLRIPPTTFAPTQAHLVIGLYDHTTGARLPLATGQDHLSFAQITLQPQPGELPNPQELVFEDGLTLAGYTLDQRQVKKPGQVTLTLYWQARSQPSHDYKVFVHLLALDQTRLAQHDSQPQNGATPTSTWLPGQTIQDDHRLAIPPEAPPGAYRFVVGLYESDSGQRLRVLRQAGLSTQADSVTLSGIRVISP